MQDLRAILREESLDALRSAYDARAMTSAMAGTIARRYPPIAAWNSEIEALFYGAGARLAAIDRERCLLAILTQTGPQLSLAVHVYWGLMEGLSLDEVCHVITLTACYAGVPRLAVGFPVIERVAKLLDGLAAARTLQPETVLQAILEEFMERQ